MRDFVSGLRLSDFAQADRRAFCAVSQARPAEAASIPPETRQGLERAKGDTR
ncbi:MAG: hypothetical protein AB7O37_20025 [Vicinamibacteria bacterium]